MPAPDARPVRRGRLRPVLGTALSVVGIAILCLLGTWQVERLQWKQDLIARIDARIHAPPVALADLARRAAAGEDVDYVPVTARGTFDHAGERYFLSTFEGQAGWNVFTPLLTGEGTAIFVNRGFVPYELRDPARRLAGEVAGEVAVTGLARAPQADPGGTLFAPGNDPAKNTFFWRDLRQMGEGLDLPAGVPLLPFTLDAGPGRAPGGWPVGGTTVIDIPNNHLQYAITWYGLAATLAVMTAALLWRSRRGRAG